MNAFMQLKGTTAFFVQSVISFTISMTAVSVGIVVMPAPVWIRAFLGLGILYVITSTFTLAKCVRDRREADVALGPLENPGPVLPPGGPYADAAGSWR
jgi:hypothetical protein